MTSNLTIISKNQSNSPLIYYNDNIQIENKYDDESDKDFKDFKDRI